MAEHSEPFGERTHEPTQLRLARARQRGLAARSLELTSAAVLGGAALAAACAGPAMLSGLTKMTASMIGMAGVELKAPGLWESGLGGAVAAAGAVALAAMTVAALAGVAQTGLLASSETVAADWDRVSPGAGLKRMFSVRTAARAGLWAAKLAGVAAVAAATLRGGMDEMISLGSMGAADMAAAVGGLAWRLTVRMVLVLLAVGTADYLYQRWQYRRDLRMTQREFRDDMRQMEGNAMVRNRRRREASRLAGRRGADETTAAIGEIP